MSEFKIEKNVPIPRSGNNRKWPWPDMEIGDSVLLPFNGENPKTFRNRLSGSLIFQAPKRFVTRAEEGVGIRVWRVADRS